MNNLESKHSISMKFGQFMSYSKRNRFIKKFCKNCSLKTSSRPFWVCKELSTASIGRWNFWSNLLILDISPNQHTGLNRFLFTKDSLKIKKGLELVPMPIFHIIFYKKFILKCYINWSNFITRLCLLPKLFNEMCFVFHA